nr:MAG TPA: hypothetical protein [Caudoviricetes sp.]
MRTNSGPLFFIANKSCIIMRTYCLTRKEY